MGIGRSPCQQMIKNASSGFFYTSFSHLDSSCPTSTDILSLRFGRNLIGFLVLTFICIVSVYHSVHWLDWLRALSDHLRMQQLGAFVPWWSPQLPFYSHAFVIYYFLVWLFFGKKSFILICSVLDFVSRLMMTFDPRLVALILTYSRLTNLKCFWMQ